MDAEEGVEVVWNEVQFSERKNFKVQEEKMQLVFENLNQLEHPNIIKFHRCWTGTHNDKPQIVVFTADNSAAVIPKLWLTENNKKAYWPPYMNPRKIENAVKNQEDPQLHTWKKFDILKVLSTAESYDEAVQKGEIALYTSEVDEEYERLQDKTLRNTRHKKSMESTNSDDDDNDELQHKKKKFKCNNFPIQPQQSKYGQAIVEKDKCSFEQPTRSLSKILESTDSLKANLLANDEHESSSSTSQSGIIEEATFNASIASQSKNFNDDNCEELFMDPKEVVEMWCVVQFTDEQKKQVVPELWLQDSGQVIVWPPYMSPTMIEDAIEHMKKPESDWYERKIYKIFKKTDTYAKALQFIYNNEEASKQGIFQKGDDSCDADQSSTLLLMKNKLGNVQVKQQHTKPVITSVKIIKKPCDIPQPTVTHKIRMPLAEVSNLSEKNQYNYLIEMVGEILENQAEEKVKLDALMLQRGNSDKTSLNMEDMEEMQSIFPINSLRGFLKLHEDLQQKEWQLKFKLFFGSFGGRTEHFRMRNMLAGLITKKVAVEYSFVGKKKHAFSKHRAWKCLLSIAVKPNSGYTIHNAEETTKSWLKEANKIKYKKSAPVNSTEAEGEDNLEDTDKTEEQTVEKSL